MEVNTTSPNSVKWHLELVIVFVLFMITGVTPWERLLSIQIRNGLLIWITSFSMGLVGLIGLAAILIIDIRHNSIRFFSILTIFLSSIILISCFLLVMTFVLPAFEWKDKDIYRNGNDYLVIQEQEDFVTSNLTYPRIIRTPSPFATIRAVEEQNQLTADDERFEGNEIIYQGKTWVKVLTK